MVNKPPRGSPWCAWCQAAGAGDVSTTATLSAECGHAVGGQICLAFTGICEFPASNQLVKLKPRLLCAEEQTCGGSSLHSSPLSPARWAPNICLLDPAFAPCSFTMQRTSASSAQELTCPWFRRKKSTLGREEKRNWGSNVYVPHKFGNKYIFKWGGCGLYFFIPVMLSCTVNCWLFFHALDLLDMCQVVSLLPLAFVSTLQTAGKNIFSLLSLSFSLSCECSLLGSSETNFEQLLFLLIAVVWC